MRAQILVPFLVIPSVFLGRQRRQHLLQARESYLQQCPDYLFTVSIVTVDGVTLDGMEYRHPAQASVHSEKQKWILFLNPNGATYEEELPYLVKYAASVGVSLLAFNYRSVGFSEGTLHTSSDLIRDGEAAIQFLIARGVKSDHILVHGHSMGGAVGSYIRLRHSGS